MSRIAPISNYEESELAPLFERAEKWMGFQPNDGLLMAHKPTMLISFFTLAKAIYEDGLVDQGLKRMVGHISSLSAGCQYCSAHTAFSAEKHGVSNEKMKAIWEFQNSLLFTEKEKAALNLAVKSSMTPNQVTDADFDVLKKHFSKEAIVEIVGVISLFGFLNRWNSTFNTELEQLPKTHYENIKSKSNA